MATTERSLWIRNARIVDGTGAPARDGAIAIRDGRIAAVGDSLDPSLLPPDAAEIDAAGRVVSPGFIDVHTHFDPQICWDRLATPSLEHGVTTVLMGNCSLSLAPVRADDRRALAGMFKQIEDIPLETFEAAVPWCWESYGDYLGFVREGLGINVAGLVGHSALRHYVMGAAAQERAANDDEIEAMGRVLTEAIEAGAAGLSTSYVDIDEHLRPVASRLATKEEVIALGLAMAEAGRGLIQTVPVFYLPEVQIQNIRDMAEISRATGLLCSVAPIVHSPDNDLWRRSIDLLEEENARGARVFGQSMPRRFDVNIRLSEASFLLLALPTWGAAMRLPLEERRRAFADPGRREAFRNEAVLLGRFWDFLRVGATVDPANASLRGRLVKEIAAERGVAPADAMIDLACAEGLETEFQLAGMIQADPEAVGELLRHPCVHIGASDAGAHVAQFCGAGDTTDLLGRWVRERGTLSLERAVHRLTGELAEAFGIRGRGRIAEGLAADLVVFDPATVGRGEEEFVNDVPGGGNRYLRHATGIEAVIVNGALVWAGGRYTEARVGEIV